MVSVLWWCIYVVRVISCVVVACNLWKQTLFHSVPSVQWICPKTLQTATDQNVSRTAKCINCAAKWSVISRALESYTIFWSTKSFLFGCVRPSTLFCVFNVNFVYLRFKQIWAFFLNLTIRVFSVVLPRGKLLVRVEVAWNSVSATRNVVFATTEVFVEKNGRVVHFRKFTHFTFHQNQHT